MGLTLITVDQPSLLSKWVGESEKGLREVFKRAKQASPCILFFDEIESLVPVRSALEAGQPLLPVWSASSSGSWTTCTARWAWSSWEPPIGPT